MAALMSNREVLGSRKAIFNELFLNPPHLNSSYGLDSCGADFKNSAPIKKKFSTSVLRYLLQINV